MPVTLFGRRTKVEVAGMSFEAPPFDIELELPFSAKPDANSGTIKIYNLSKSTITKLKKGSKIVISSGYKGYMGIICPGVIEKTITNRDDVDSVTEITVGDTTDIWLRHRTNKTWKAGVKASQVVKDILAPTGIIVGQLALPKDVTYSKGKTVATATRTALEEIARDCGAKLHVARGRIYMMPLTAVTKDGAVLNTETGLIGSPEPNGEGGYHIVCMMNSMIYSDSFVEIKSKTANGRFRVTKGKYVSNDSDHIVDFEVVPLA